MNFAHFFEDGTKVKTPVEIKPPLIEIVLLEEDPGFHLWNFRKCF